LEILIMDSVHSYLLDPSAVQLAADVLDDLERVRMANAARYGALTGLTPDGREWKPDKDDKVRIAGMSPDHEACLRFRDIFDALKVIEAAAVKDLEKAMKAHPMGAWVKSQKGLGLKQAGRLLAAIGDPYWRAVLEREQEGGAVADDVPEGPRTVSALWAYSGLHVADGAAVRRAKGVKSNWSTNAKTRAYLCAESCVKQLGPACRGGDGAVEHGDACACSPYRVAYDRRKAITRASHAEDWTDGHRHTDAMRYASKEILKAMWIEARRLHVEAGWEL
jgi:hypothetical protein